MCKSNGYSFKPLTPFAPARGFFNGETMVKIKTEIFSRVVGYYRPINQWNEAKQSEYRDRKAYSLTKALEKEVDREVIR